MDLSRREFGTIGLGTALGAAAGIGGCARPARPGTLDRLALRDADAVASSIDRLDEGLRFVDGFRLHGEQDGPTPAGALARDGVRALYAASAFRDLDEAHQVHPAWQRRMASEMGRLDSGVYEFSAHVAASGLLSDPLVIDGIARKGGPAEEFCETFAAQAASCGTGLAPRFRLRSISRDVLRDMRRSSPEAVFSGHRAKALQMARLGESCGCPYEASIRSAVRREGRDAVARRSVRLTGYARQWASLGFVYDEPGADVDPVAEAPVAKPSGEVPAPRALDAACRDREAEIWTAARAKVLSAGGWTMGIAGAVGVMALIIGFTLEPITGAIMGTVAGALIIAGLVILVCGSRLQPPKS